jgi:hypothetical protein
MVTVRVAVGVQAMVATGRKHALALGSRAPAHAAWPLFGHPRETIA